MVSSKQAVLTTMTIAFFLILQFNSVIAQEVEEIGDRFGLPKDQVIVSNVKIVEEKDGISFLFKEGGFVTVRGYRYDKIREGGKIKLDFNAIPIEADFIGKGKYKFPNIPEFELENETKVLFKKDTLKFFPELVEELVPAKPLKKEVCKVRCKFAGEKEWNCWEIEGLYVRCEEESEEELIQKGMFRKIDDELFFIDKEYIEREALFYFPFAKVNIKAVKNYVKVSRNKVSGSDFKINEIHITGIKEIPAEIVVEEKGLFLLKGAAEYRGVRISGETFLEPKEIPIDKSWIKVSELSIEAKSVDPLFIEILADNELFDVNDVLELTLEQDYIKATNRKQQNLIPLIEHQGVAGGRTKIKTGIFTFTLEKGELQIEKISLIRDFIEKLVRDYLPWAPKSTAFELSSNLIKDKRLIVSSGNSFVLSPESAEGRLIMNPWGVPVTNNREYNLLVEVEQLEEKWKERGIKFEARTTPDPGTIQLVNYWLEQHPEVKIDRIVFVQDLNAFAAEMPTWEKDKENEIVIGVGTWIMDPYSVQDILGKYEIRPFEPLKTLDHEYQHAQEYYLKREDYRKFKEKARVEAEKLITPEDYVKLYLDSYKERARKLALEAEQLERYIREKRYDVLKSPLLQSFYGIDGDYRIPKTLAEKYNLPEDIRKIPWYEWKTLPNEVVDEIAALALEKIKKQKENEEWYYNYKTKEFKENREKFLEDYKGILLFYKKWAVAEKMQETMKTLGEKEFKQRPEDYLGVVLNKIGDEILNQLKEDYSYKQRIKNIITLLEEKAMEKPPGSKERKHLESVLEKIKIGSPLEIVGELRPLSEKDGHIAKESLLLQKEIEKYVPSAYSFRKYPNPIHGESYEELLTTLVELPQEERVSRAKFYPNYKKLEQILFDTGSIFTSPELYQQIFGPCKRADCLDKRCIIYKGECCRKFPNSPNCKKKG